MTEPVRMSHLSCDDCWYSCPQSDDGCCNDEAGTECNCGADRVNAYIESLEAALDAAQLNPKIEQSKETH